MSDPLYIAVDLGAGSGRVFLAGCDADELLLQEVHRFRYPPEFDGEYLRWNFGRIFDDVMAGLKLASANAVELGRSVACVGVDSWGVDYGLVDEDGNLTDDPVCYRDDRTDDAMDRVFSIVSRDEIYSRTGIQFQKFNTLFQLNSKGNDTDNGAKLLLLPDLINYKLTGIAKTEFTNATTTQMVNISSGNWDVDLLDRLDMPQRLLQEIVYSGTSIGRLRPEITAETGLTEAEVIAPATHDTASAVAAAPLSNGSAYISSGTWSLIGIERSEPLITGDALRLNFTNEGGAFGTYRFLKNVMGLWIFESCRREWETEGKVIDYEKLISEAAEISGFPAFIYPDDERFLNPTNMLETISTQLGETGQDTPKEPSTFTKIIFDSLAFRYASVLRSIESITGTKLTGIEILGGGGRNRYLNQMTANATGLSVRAGLTEATVVGNVLVQAIASGRFNSLGDGRKYVASRVDLESFIPQATTETEDASVRYSEIESRFSDGINSAAMSK